MELPTKTATLMVDSTHRSAIAYPTPYQYAVALAPTYTDVISVALMCALYPQITDVDATTQVIRLYIDELAQRRGEPFTHLPVSTPARAQVDQRAFRSCVVFQKPLQKLTRLTLRFVQVDAQGRERLCTQMPDHALRFEITSLLPSSHSRAHPSHNVVQVGRPGLERWRGVASPHDAGTF